MADFTNGFWDIYIVVLTLLGVFGCGVLLYSQSKVKLAKAADGKVGTTGHIWDEDLTELNTPMPRWWMWLFYITIVFALAYLFLYPGLGTYAGKLGWKSSGQYQTELKQAEADYGPLFAKYQTQDLKTVAADPQARAIGERLFLTYCAQCHGSDARGNKGFPNLTDNDWLFGGAPDTIKETIMHGRRHDAADGRRARLRQGCGKRRALCAEPVGLDRRPDQGGVRQGQVRRLHGLPQRQRVAATRCWARPT
jgi:cytochrome c oxidase cbb3-type subunit 3